MTFAMDLAPARGDEIALRDADRDYTWSEIDSYLRPAVNALRNAELGELGRVAIFAQNSAQTLLAYVACTLAGASAVAVNSHLTAKEAAYIFADCKAGIVLCDSASATVAVGGAVEAGIETVVAWGDGTLPDSVVPWRDWCEDDREPSTLVAPRPTLVYTSGTTGRPKGVELPKTSWVGGDTVDEHLARLRLNSMVGHGRHLVVGPMYHSGPLSSTRLLAAGVPVTVLGKFDAEKLLATIERDEIGSSIMVPTHFQRLLALPQSVRQSADLSSLRFVLQVGSKCPVDVKRSIINWWGDVIWESYGASEVGSTCMISANEWLQRPGSVGRSIPPFDAYIRADDGGRAAPHVEGPLWFRDETGNGIEYTNGARSGPDFTLGEIGRMDEEGYVWITDRLSDMVVSGGVNIYPAEIEQALIGHESVADAAVYGVPDTEMGERLVAVIVPTDSTHPPTRDEITVFLRKYLAGFKIPRAIHVVGELPRSAVGKLDKRAIRRLGLDDRTEANVISEVGASR